MKINLPDLQAYRRQFKARGITTPLPVVPNHENGLLNLLPKADPSKTGWPWTQQVETTAYDGFIKWPKLTIITPSYNQVNFIEETIRSVLLQNYPNLEYIVIDGGSTDSTIEVLKKYSPWLSYWQSEQDGGQGNAINQGFSLASGAYYAWINSDDYYLKETFKKVIQRFLSSKADFVYGYNLDFNVQTKQFQKLSTVLPFIDFFIRMPSLAQPACFWNAKIHQPIWEQLHCSLDYELWLRMVKGQKKGLIKEPLSVANIHIAAKTSDPGMKAKWRHDHELICSNDAHGPVPNWNTIVFINRIRVKLYKWLKLT